MGSVYFCDVFSDFTSEMCTLSVSISFTKNWKNTCSKQKIHIFHENFTQNRVFLDVENQTFYFRTPRLWPLTHQSQRRWFSALSHKYFVNKLHLFFAYLCIKKCVGFEDKCSFTRVVCRWATSNKRSFFINLNVFSSNKLIFLQKKLKNTTKSPTLLNWFHLELVKYCDYHR